MILLIWWPLVPMRRETMPSGTKMMTEKDSVLIFLDPAILTTIAAFAAVSLLHQPTHLIVGSVLVDKI